MSKSLKNRFGLTDRDMQTIQVIFNKYPEVEEVHIFGSRAKGIHKNGSDIDLAVMNQGVNENNLTKMRSDFEESSLPFKIDLINFPTLKHSGFIDHIKRVGITIYRKK
jgi:predicted nucleotidyltransferase